MELAAVLLIVLAFSMAMATFIENDFGVSASKALIYHSDWFEAVIALVFINLIVNVFRIKPLKTAKWAVFIFHLAFIFIILGAAITRYIGYEGLMSIREGQASGTFQSDEVYVMISDEDSQILNEKEVLFSTLTKNEVSLDFEIKGQSYSLNTYDFTPNAMDYIAETEHGKPMFEITVKTQQNYQSFSLESGKSIVIQGRTIGFDVEELHDINIKSTKYQAVFSFNDTVEHFNMMTGEKRILYPDSLYEITMRNLYTLGDFNWVFKNYYPKAELKVMTAGQKTGIDAIHFNITDDNDRIVYESYVSGASSYSAPLSFNLNGETVTVAYGSQERILPFSIMLRDFQLERYPASNSPSSYASEVTLLDEADGVNMDYRIFMNHVLDYKGYRFFQSSYDTDEKGTVLSVNHDFAGMVVTYLGYAFMILGMFLALFSKKTRFRYLMKKTSHTAIIILGLIVLSPMISYSQTSACVVDKIPSSQVEALSTLLVQGHSGRFQPFNSISNQVVRKFSRKTSYQGMNTDRILLGMMMNPGYWTMQPLIKVSNDDLKDIIGNHHSRVPFSDFFEITSEGNRYKLEKYIDAAYRKKPSERGKFEKDLITVDERVNVFYMAMHQSFLQIFPVPGKENENWKTPEGPFDGIHGKDSAFVVSIFDYYLQSLILGQKTNDYTDANMALEGIEQYQKNYASNYNSFVAKRDQEILYNKIGVFDLLLAPYGIFGFIMLIILFIRVLQPKFQMKWPVHILAIMVLLTFVAHTFGLAARWYIAEHAPWSDGYESMIFIGWATILAGLVFYKNSPISLAATSVLTFLILFVAHLSWMNPEITNLVPVLKSYWLTIHVAIITGSYGFLFLGAFMGFLNLIFLIFQNDANSSRITEKVKEISRINEMTLIVGLYLLTIGTFLGAIWGNESWGRYWGWDPKETWALITILLYAFITHMRFVPGLKGLFAFNFMSLIAYFSVLMTYFGVNYYLSGLHSYASGDPMPIPDFVYYVIAVIIMVTAVANYKFRKYWGKE